MLHADTEMLEVFHPLCIHSICILKCCTFLKVPEQNVAVPLEIKGAVWSIVANRETQQRRIFWKYGRISEQVVGVGPKLQAYILYYVSLCIYWPHIPLPSAKMSHFSSIFIIIMFVIV